MSQDISYQGWSFEFKINKFFKKNEFYCLFFRIKNSIKCIIGALLLIKYE